MRRPEVEIVMILKFLHVPSGTPVRVKECQPHLAKHETSRSKRVQQSPSVLSVVSRSDQRNCLWGPPSERVIVPVVDAVLRQCWTSISSTVIFLVTSMFAHRPGYRCRRCNRGRPVDPSSSRSGEPSTMPSCTPVRVKVWADFAGGER